MSSNISFGLKKEEEKNSKNENKDLFKGNIFSIKKNENIKSDDKPKIKSLFETNDSIGNIFEKSEKKSIFESSNKKKKIVEGEHNNESKRTNNLFIKTE